MNDVAREGWRPERTGSAGSADDRYGWMQQAIAAGAVIVTANKRLSRELQRAWDAAQLAGGARSWHTPAILSWNAWLGSLLDDADGTVPLRLDTHASAIVWEQLLKARVRDRMLNMAGFLRQVQQAWQRLHDWCVSPADLDRHARSQDERLFAGLATAYREKLAANAWIDYAQLASFAGILLRERRLPVPGRIVYAGFDRLHPAAECLFRQFEAAGCAVSPAPRRNRRETADVVSCADRDAELRSAGLWARGQLQADSAARVAIVCSTLEQDAARAARLVREGFAPGWQCGGRDHEVSVNVSYGKPLSTYPMIAVALLWLEWTCRTLSSRELSVLLRSPFAGRGTTDGRCRLEAALRRLPDRHWRAPAAAAALTGRDGTAGSEDWLQRVQQLAATSLAGPGSATPAEWASEVDALLQRLVWPGERPLDSLEFQLLNRWRELLNELARLDVVRPRMSAAEAVFRLSSMAAGTIWQPETGAGRVQLIGSLEASGLEFDALWVSGLDAETWPPPARPVPLISRTLQRKAGMPDATPADTLEFSRRVCGRLAESAARVVLSWPENEPEMALAPSALLEPYRTGSGSPARDPGWYASALAGKAGFDRALADPVPPVRAGEKLWGGAYTVQRQVREPFAAFAGGRLGAKELQRIEAGLSPGVRGSIVHSALHRLLADRPTQAQLRAWSGPDLDARIADAADVALSRHMRHADGLLRRLLGFERERLCEMLAAFVAEERARPEFAVDAVEKATEFSAHGVRLDLRIDRIDRLSDGSLLIIDYKTGALKSLLDRNGEAKELQLVVYALATGARVGGLLLINVDTRGIVYKGAGAGWDASSGEPWDTRLARWQTAVDSAVAAMAAGDARVHTALAPAEARPLAVLSRVEEMKRER